jgi:hypothetical protein
VTAVRAVDTATHPEHQGRGIFSSLTLAALDALRGDVDLVFNTPNEKSLPGYLKMGWTQAGRVPIAVRVRRPLRFATRARAHSVDSDPSRTFMPPVLAPPASEALGDTEGLSLLLQRSETFPQRLTTLRSVDYLRWRYAAAPLLDYRAIASEDGLAIFRVRSRGELCETTVSELIARDADRAAARRLFRAVLRAARVDHVTSSFPAGSASRVRRFGSFPAPGGVTFVVNPLASDVTPDPRVMASWALTIGDLEVF